MNKINGFINNIIQQDIKKKIITKLRTRFPPEPNGYLHIGHIKSMHLNFILAEYYKGCCKLRFDDTNPKKEKNKFVTSIKKDILWMGFNLNKNITFTSEYFEIIYQYAIELIKKKLAYVDQLNKIQIKQYRGTLKQPGKNSPYRNQTIEESLNLFKKMKKGFFSEGQACLRAKINMKASSILMRDPVLYRIIHKEHHKTKNSWLIYPTYDFAHCISDSIEGITHSLCTLEFKENKKLYEWILDNISVVHYPKQYEYARLKLEYTVLSKRKLTILVKNKIVSGWNDPRMPTISGLKKKGYTPESLKKFCNKIGVSKQDSLIELHSLESCIRNELNKQSMRTMAIIDPILVIIENMNEKKYENISVLNHPKMPNMGIRNIVFSKEIYIDKSDFKEYADEKYKGLTLKNTVRLRYAYTIKVKDIKYDKKGNIKKILCTYDNTTLHTYKNQKKKIGIIHWISKNDAIPAYFYFYSPLFTIKNPEIEKNFLNFINLHSKIKKKGFVNKETLINFNNYPFQFERIGYFFIDKKYTNKIVFHQTVSLKNKR
ncbi:glutamine--tRNA ligase [Buchnera aphidicola (Thelaxes californica)]|uniref:Glutamine--tRNA ligase n=1 Tax=Buchnera aphidicola (Thelaxes californica) TaxID=1315998 RepID=A0A4D6YP20_9GAMM|nr:glutamine--tRNA ligase [Buchnera aphidicola]QCI26845.1 glutamine--tRNA ligase [Buchnera aphidicola (Thelaxes californica)]